MQRKLECSLLSLALLAQDQCDFQENSHDLGTVHLVCLQCLLAMVWKLNM